MTLSHEFVWFAHMRAGTRYKLMRYESEKSMTKVLVVKKVFWKFNEFRQWGLGRCLIYDGVPKLTHSSINETVWYSPSTLCPFALSTYSGRLRSSSRMTFLLNFHHLQELSGDALQARQWQDFIHYFRALGSLFGLCDTLDLLNWVFLLSLKHGGH